MIETKNGRVGVIDICSTFENAARAGSQTPRIPGRPGLNALRTHNLYKITKEHAAYLEEINKNTGLNSLREKHRAQGFIPSLAENRMEFGTMEFTIVDSNEQEGRWSYSDKRDVERTLNGIKEALYTCEAVVIMIHSHEIKADQEYEADYFMEEFAHACIDAGACAVVGSGTHQMKGIEFIRTVLFFTVLVILYLKMSLCGIFLLIIWKNTGCRNLHPEQKELQKEVLRQRKLCIRYRKFIRRLFRILRL